MTVPLSDRAANHGSLHHEVGSSTWSAGNSLPADRYDLERLLELKHETVSVVLPAREVGETIGPVLDALVPLRAGGLVEEILVVDADSRDSTVPTSVERGAAVLRESTLLPEFGGACGKGDAMWRGLAATSGDIVVYLDTDTGDFDARFLLGMLGPLFERSECQFVKGTFRRPFKVDDVAVPDGGGRVTELVARPLLNLFVPELAVFGQPLAGETAGRRALLETLDYPVGYGVEIAMMIDVAKRVGVEAMAQVDLGTRQNRHQPLRDLSVMALAVLGAASRRLHGSDSLRDLASATIALPGEDGAERREVSLAERPPLATVSSEERRAARSQGLAALAAATEAATAPGESASPSESG